MASLDAIMRMNKEKRALQADIATLREILSELVDYYTPLEDPEAFPYEASLIEKARAALSAREGSET